MKVILFCNSIVLRLLLSYAVCFAANAGNEEPNNTANKAYFLLVNPPSELGQRFKFDYLGDEDWFTFYAQKEQLYDIEIPANSIDTEINPTFKLYDAQGEIPPLDTNLKLLTSWQPPTTGFYYIRITNQAKEFNTNSHYRLRISLSDDRRQNVYVNGTVLDKCNQKPLKAAVKTTETIDQALTSSEGIFSIPYNPGTYTLTASTNDGIYDDQRLTVSESEQHKVIVKNLIFELPRKKGCDAPLSLPPPPDPNQAVAIYDEITGELLLREIHYLSQIFSAEFKDQGGLQFKLTRLTTLARSSFSETAYFDFDNELGDIPRVYALKQLFHIKMRSIGDNIYILDGPIIPVE